MCKVCLNPFRPMNASLFHITDSFGNTKHDLHLDREHRSLDISARSTVEKEPAVSPPERCEEGAWDALRSWRDSFHHWDFLNHSGLTRPSANLVDFVKRNGVERAADPLVSLQRRTMRRTGERRRTPGWNACCPDSAGLDSIPPIRPSSMNGMYALPWVGTTRTFPPQRVCCTAEGITGSRWKCACNHFRVPVPIYSVIN